MAALHLRVSPSLCINHTEWHPAGYQIAPLVQHLTGRASPFGLGCSAAAAAASKRWHSSGGAGNLRSKFRGLVTVSRASTLQGTEKSAGIDARENVSRIEIRTLQGCSLGIAMYPDFVYNGEGGGGYGTAQELQDELFAVEFDTEKLYIPPLESKTTRFLGLPLPPFIRIEVIPQSLKGFIEQTTGKVELKFSAKFMFSVGSLYRAPPLIVDTLLTTEETEGRMRKGQGTRLDGEGKVRLVGIAPLAPIEDVFMNAFLTLPTDCVANMAAKFSFSL